MAFVVKVARTLRNNWKKSIFFSGLTVYGANYIQERHEENLLRRVYCAEAKKYGDEKIPVSERPRRITVFLNPAAQAGKAKKLYEKNAAPILNLAGIEVNVVKTEYEGQIKKFVGVLEPGETDAIVVAGGDGALLEMVTGILRKEDKKFHKIPVGVIPLGYTNTFSQLFYGADKGAVRMIADASMAIVNGLTKKVDVLKIDGGEGKTTFALCGMEMGAYRDAEERKSRYWYFGPLKTRWTYVRTALGDWPPALEADLSYVVATEENMKIGGSQHVPTKRSWNFFKFLFRKDQAPKEDKDVLDEEEAEGEDAVSRTVSTVELSLMTPNMVHNQEFPAIQLAIGPDEPPRTEFISEGWRRMENKVPNYGSGDNKKFEVKNVSINVKGKSESGPLWYNIDGEAFEAIPVKVSLLREKLNFFYPVFDPTQDQRPKNTRTLDPSEAQQLHRQAVVKPS